MRKRTSTITEEYSPTFRRRMPSKYLNISLPNFGLMEDQELGRSYSRMEEIKIYKE